MNPKKKNQHFVPKFYLRNFSYLKNEKKIGLYNTKNHLYFKNAPLKSQASKDFFYGTDGIIEDSLSEIEGHLAIVIKKIIDYDSPELSQDDLYSLLLFIVLTDFRNPNHIHGISEMMIKMRQRLFEEVPDTDNMDELLPIPSHEECVRLALNNCLEIVKGIQDLKYKILVNLTDIPFVTSDCPVVKYNQYLEWKRWKPPKTGYGSIGLQIFLPLSHNKVILLYDLNSYEVGNPNYITHRLKKTEDIDELNLLQLINCIETIYFDEKVSEQYIKEMHEWAKEFNKANIPYSNLGYLVDNESDFDKKPERKNLLINGTTDCETNLKISGLRLTPAIKYRKLNDSAAQPRPGSLIYKSIKNSR